MLGKRAGKNNNCGGLSLVALVLVILTIQDGAQSCLLTKNFLVSVSDTCTGVMLSDRHVLAPGKCGRAIKGEAFVRFGSDDLSNPSSGKVINAGSANFSFDADLCVFKLKDRIKRFDSLLRANYVRLFRPGREDLSPYSKLYLMGFESRGYGSKSCYGSKIESRVDFESDTGVCGHKDDNSIICATTNTQLAPYCDGLQCSGFLIEKQGNFLGLGGFRLLVGVPTACKGSVAKNARAFTKVSKHIDWIMEQTEGEAVLY